MENQVLSIEQMQHLKKLGVDVYMASMGLFRGTAVVRYNKGVESVFDETPTFTFLDMLEMMPLDIRFSHPDKNLWQCTYNESGEDESLDGYVLRESESAMKCCYEMLCWLAENGYLKKKTLKQDEIYKHLKGIKVRVKDSVQCHQCYHDGGILTFQDRKDVDKGEYCVGIQVEGGVCFDFHPDDYELINNGHE